MQRRMKKLSLNGWPTITVPGEPWVVSKKKHDNLTIKFDTFIHIMVDTNIETSVGALTRNGAYKEPEMVTNLSLEARLAYSFN